MTIQEYQNKVDEWIKSYGVRYFNELTNVALLMEEVGELARYMARYKGEQSFRKGTEPTDPQRAIEEELADILFVVVCLANQMDIDLENAISLNMRKKSDRDAHRHKQNPKLQ